MQADPLMNLPNALTLVRMFLVPLLVVVLLTEFEGRQILGISKDIVGAGIFALASLTDWLDGYLARRRRQVTWFGQMLDRSRQAAHVGGVHLAGAARPRAGVDGGAHHRREFAVTALRSLAYAKGITIPASSLGQVQDGVAGHRDPAADSGRRSDAVPGTPGYFVLWAVMVLAVVSAVDYYRRFQGWSTRTSRT
jgi:CDP-diacylglycerol--glycerol-3-phosphate 3-phosphatidyltransferase